MVFICFDAVFAALLMDTGNDVNGNDEWCKLVHIVDFSWYTLDITEYIYSFSKTEYLYRSYHLIKSSFGKDNVAYKP